MNTFSPRGPAKRATMRCVYIARAALVCLLTVTKVAGAVVPLAVTDELQLLPDGAVRLHGHLGEKIDLCLQGGVAAQNVPALVQPFHDRRDLTEWRSEFWGKWITSAIEAYRWNKSPELGRTIQGAVDSLRAAQSPDGYIGAYAPENRLQRWDVWGRKYTMLGLLAWHDASGDTAALKAAVGVADHLLTEAGPDKGNPFRNDMWHGMATSSVLEPMVLLYRRTGDVRYLEFCRWLLGEWERDHGPDLIRKALAGTDVFRMFADLDPRTPGPKPVGSSKAYEMMSCYEGLIELHRVTGQTEYRRAAEMVFANIRDTEITVVGSGSDWERWCAGHDRQTEDWRKGMETCVTVTWIKFAAQLLRLTGDSRYADEIETAAYNALLGALGKDGAWWAHYSPLAGVKHPAPRQGGMNQNCCVASGPRGLMLLPALAIMQGRQGPVINLFTALSATVPLPSGRYLQVDQATRYPQDGGVKITLVPEQSEEFTLGLRIPQWSQATTVTVNGEIQAGAEAGKYLALTRVWQAGDVVQLDFDMSPRLVTAPGDGDFMAMLRGPLVLASDARLGAAPTKQDMAGFAAAAHLDVRPPPPALAEDVWLTFEATTAEGRAFMFCDFSSAGSEWGNSAGYRVWLPLK